MRELMNRLPEPSDSLEGEATVGPRLAADHSGSHRAGHRSWIATTMGYVHIRQPGSRMRGVLGTSVLHNGWKGCCYELEVAVDCSEQGGSGPASEMSRRLAEHGMVISPGKMSRLWSGQPVSLKLDDLDVIWPVGKGDTTW